MTLAKGEIRLNHPVEIMRFTLVFDGQLKSTAHADVEDKMVLRREFHRQLGEVWQRKILLEKYFTPWLEWAKEKGSKARWDALTEEQKTEHYNTSLMIPFFKGEFCFIPIVTDRHHLVCELDILYLTGGETWKSVQC